MQATPIHFMTVREQADLLASGEITSVELTRHFLDRAAELDPPPFELPSEPRSDHDGMLATMVTIAREHALEAAERADECPVVRAGPPLPAAVAGGDGRCFVEQVRELGEHAIPWIVKDAPPSLRAKRSNPTRRICGWVDCFVASLLAMTA